MEAAVPGRGVKGGIGHTLGGQDLKRPRRNMERDLDKWQDKGELLPTARE